MPNKLDVFDFDGTLHHSPHDTPKNRKLYESKTGLPWIIDKALSNELSKKHDRFIPVRKGWYGRRETLEPPLVPNPAPKENFIQDICKRFLESKNNPDTLTVLMTGRHRGIAHQVLRICGDGGLIKVEQKTSKKDSKLYVEIKDENVMCYFMGDNGPVEMTTTKPSSTLPWKIWIMESLLEAYPDLDTVEIWEDRESHVETFKELNNSWDHRVIVNFVTG